MNKYSVANAIESGTWHECKGKYFEEEISFRLRILAFRRTTIEEIDESLINEVVIEGILWLMSVEVINLCKKPIDAWKLRDTLVLIDEDEYEFEYFSNSDLDQDEDSGLHRFSGWSSNTSLSPKIKAVGAIPFVLPDEENNYYLMIKDGQIQEA